MLRLPQELRIAIAELGGRGTAKALRSTHSDLEASGSNEVFKTITVDLGDRKSIVVANEFASNRLIQNLACLVIRVRVTPSNTDRAVWLERWFGIQKFITLSMSRSRKFRKVVIQFERYPPFSSLSSLLIDFVVDTIYKGIPSDLSQCNTRKFHLRLEGVKRYHVNQLCIQFANESIPEDWLNFCEWSFQAELPECLSGDVEIWQDFLRLYQRFTSCEIDVGSRVTPMQLKQIFDCLPVSDPSCITIRASDRTYKNLQANLPTELMQRVINQG